MAGSSKRQTNTFNAQGIEPDKAIFNTTQERQLPVRCGYFPEILKSDEKYDIIVFNDVFEHIPEPADIISQCCRHLNDSGLLVIKLPSNQGFFYRTSKLLAYLGITKPFERMWQHSLPSPHLHYFNSKNLIRLLEKNSFEVVSTGQLPTIHFNGLYSRIKYIAGYSLLSRALIYLGVIICSPLIKIFPSDAIYTISQKSALKKI